MALLRSYVAGGWHTAPDEGTPLHDATTGEEVARISSTGIDMAGALAYGRDGRRPGAARADLPPAGRAAQGARPRTCASTARSSTRCPRAPAPRSATPSSTSTAASACCSATPARAAASCPTTPSTSTARVEPLGKGGTFVGQHILTPLRGVAVQINAFNFPVWGPLEKFAPAFLAGRAQPDQAGQPDRVPHRAAGRADRRVAACCPRARCSSSRGSAGDLLDHLTEQDLVALHRLGVDRAAAARAPGGRAQLGAVQRRGRLAELLDPRPGRRTRHAPSSTCTSSSWSPR